MKNKHSSELYASLSASNVESNNNNFETLSLRIPHRTAAMIQTLNIGFQKSVLTLFTNQISKHLAESLLGSVNNEPLILEEAENGIQPDSALDLLMTAGAITYDNEMLRNIKTIFQKEGK